MLSVMQDTDKEWVGVAVSFETRIRLGISYLASRSKYRDSVSSRPRPLPFKFIFQLSDFDSTLYDLRYWQRRVVI
jgi:hypothetical protein